LHRSGWQRLEQLRSNWERRILLPTKINTNRSKAYIDNGVLTIIFPIESPEKSLMKRIKVNMPSVKLPDIGKKSGKIKVHHK
jgi:HSP20 family molecular chaperone IbpA